MAVTGVVRFKLGKVQDVTNLISAYFELKISQRYKDCTICVYEEAQKKSFVSR